MTSNIFESRDTSIKHQRSHSTCTAEGIPAGTYEGTVQATRSGEPCNPRSKTGCGASGCWLAGQVAARSISFPDLLLRAQDGEKWAGTHTVTGALNMLTSQETIDQVRVEKALARREAARKERRELLQTATAI